MVARVREITSNLGVDVSLNSVASDTFGRDFELLAPLGLVIWYGMAGGPPQENLAELVSGGFGKSIGIRTFAIYSLANRYPSLFAEARQQMVDLLVAGRINPPIHDRLPLAEARRAHELLESGVVTGKVILNP